MIRDTSAAVDEAVAVLREQIADIRDCLRKAVVGRDKADLEQRLLAMLDRLATVENNRANVLVQFIAGRRGLDRLPEADLEVVVKAIADFAPPVVEEKKE